MEILKRVADATEHIAKKLPDPKPAGKTTRIDKVVPIGGERKPLREVKSNEVKK